MEDQEQAVPFSFFADAFRDSAAPTVILSADGLVLFWNAAAERAFGWSAAEAIGKPLPFIPPEKADEHRAMRKHDLTGAGFTNRHISRRRKDGSPIDLNVSTAPIRDADGRVARIISVYTDITIEKREEESLRLRQKLADRQISQLAELTQQLQRQQADLRLVIDGVPGLIAYIDREYRYRFVNRSYAEWFDRSASEFEGRTIAELLNQGWFADFQPQLDAAFAGQLTSFEGTVLHRGRQRDMRVTYAPDHAADGRVRGLVVVLWDITEQKHAVQALRESEERFRRIVEIAAEGIWIVNPQGKTTFVNRRMTDILGYSSSEMMGRSFVDFLHPEDRDRGIQGFSKRKEGYAEPKEYRCQRRDGATVWLDFTASQMRDDEGELTGILGMCTDITERRRADQQLRQTQKLESLGVLAGGIAHDFNNLLVGIMGNASLALDILPPSTQAISMLQDVIGASERAALLTRQLLAYAGRDHRTVLPTNLTTIVRELGPLLGASIPRLVQVSLELDEDLPLVFADQAQLQQVVMNLIINAAEAIPERVPGMVTITTRRRKLSPQDHQLAVFSIESTADEYVELSVRDTGSGMDVATQARIFDPFYTTKSAGRGLGLSAVLGIVRAHQGALTLQSALGQGTCFTVLLPVVSTTVQTASGDPKTSTARRGSGTILVVDDESSVRDMVRRALELSGYEVLLAIDGVQGIQQVKDHPDIRAVVLDFAMPKMGGESAATHIRALRPDVPIVFSSGYAEYEVRQGLSEGGISAFLQKPYTSRLLLEKLAEVLNDGMGGAP